MTALEHRLSQPKALGRELSFSFSQRPTCNATSSLDLRFVHRSQLFFARKGLRQGSQPEISVCRVESRRSESATSWLSSYASDLAKPVRRTARIAAASNCARSPLSPARALLGSPPSTPVPRSRNLLDLVPILLCPRRDGPPVRTLEETLPEPCSGTDSLLQQGEVAPSRSKTTTVPSTFLTWSPALARPPALARSPTLRKPPASTRLRMSRRRTSKGARTSTRSPKLSPASLTAASPMRSSSRFTINCSPPRTIKSRMSRSLA